MLELIAETNSLAPEIDIFTKLGTLGVIAGLFFYVLKYVIPDLQTRFDNQLEEQKEAVAEQRKDFLEESARCRAAHKEDIEAVAAAFHEASERAIKHHESVLELYLRLGKDAYDKRQGGES